MFFFLLSIIGGVSIWYALKNHETEKNEDPKHIAAGAAVATVPLLLLIDVWYNIPFLLLFFLYVVMALSVKGLNDVDTEIEGEELAPTITDDDDEATDSDIDEHLDFDDDSEFDDFSQYDELDDVDYLDDRGEIPESEFRFVTFSYTNAKGERSIREVRVDQFEKHYFLAFCMRDIKTKTFRYDHINGIVKDTKTGEKISVGAWHRHKH